MTQTTRGSLQRTLWGERFSNLSRHVADLRERGIDASWSDHLEELRRGHEHLETEFARAADGAGSLDLEQTARELNRVIAGFHWLESAVEPRGS